jgi:peptidoglycan hydrolase-like protein with peptidoglycan-binding domain
MRRTPLNSRGDMAVITLIVFVIAAVGGVAFFALSRHSSKTPVASTSHSCLGKTLKEGDSGVCVKDAQALVNAKAYGINQPNYGPVDGTFGPATTVAVKVMQKNLKISQSGTLDASLWAFICNAGEDSSPAVTAAIQDAGCKL